MPTLRRSELNRLIAEFNARADRLLSHLKYRDIESNREGAPRNRVWSRPEELCATLGSSAEISLAIADFNAILAELKKLK